MQVLNNQSKFKIYVFDLIIWMKYGMNSIQKYELIKYWFREINEFNSSQTTFCYTIFLMLKISLMMSFMSEFYFLRRPFVIVSIESFIIL